MSLRMEDPRPIAIEEKRNVIVVGGGIGGIAAAVAAARNGSSVLLLEKNLQLGGLATLGLISWYEPLCDGNGNQMVYGIGEELIRLACKYSPHDLPSVWNDGGKASGDDPRFACFFSPAILSLALNELLEEEGVELLLDVVASYPVMKEQKAEGVVVQAREGRIFFPCDVLIDATGDASILEKAGVPTCLGKNFMSYVSHIATSETLHEVVKKNDFVKLRKWKWIGYTISEGGDIESFSKMAGVTSKDQTLYTRYGQKCLLDWLKQQDIGSVDIVSLPNMAQFRTCRHLEGAVTFDASSTTCLDSIGITGDFRKRGPRYQIPFGALYHPSYDNLLAVGRIISAKGEGWEISRVIPVCALTGQAAGTAASMTKGNTPFSSLNIMDLQTKLVDAGVRLRW